MSRTVDLVIAGDGSGARDLAVRASRQGRRVLVVMRSGDARLRRRFRRALGNAQDAGHGEIELVTNAEVVCADGIGRVEAVIIRDVRTGHLFAVNASAFVLCAQAPASSRAQ